MVLVRCRWAMALLLWITLPAYATQGLPDFAGLVAQQGAVVVKINMVRSQGAGQQSLKLPDMPEGAMGEMLKHFLGEKGILVPEETLPNPQAGSGFIISSDGEIVTNYHVIDGASEINVELQDGRSFPAKLMGSDINSDVALLKIEAQGLPVAKFGSSQALRVGEWVLAIGSPFGFDYSVTAGIVSAKGRSLPSENYVPFIQTDVAINPGNSGGPLFNLQGEVVGVNSQIYTRSRGYMGVSFAVPSDLVVDMVQQLRQKGFVSRGWLGVMVQNVTHELVESFGLSKPEGALVVKVLPEGPAALAGINVGDVILALDQQAVQNSAALPRLVGALAVGHEVKLKVIRDKQPLLVTLKIGQLPTAQELQAVTQPPDKTETVQALPLGLRVAPLSDELRRTAKVSEGVVLESVQTGSLAEQSGLRTGDILLMLDQKSIKDVSQFNEIASQIGKKGVVAVLIQRQATPIFLALKLAP